MRDIVNATILMCLLATLYSASCIAHADIVEFVDGNVGGSSEGFAVKIATGEEFEFEDASVNSLSSDGGDGQTGGGVDDGNDWVMEIEGYIEGYIWDLPDRPMFIELFAEAAAWFNTEGYEGEIGLNSLFFQSQLLVSVDTPAYVTGAHVNWPSFSGQIKDGVLSAGTYELSAFVFGVSASDTSPSSGWVVRNWFLVFAKPGDLNGDGSVGVADLLLLLNAWGPCTWWGGGCLEDLTGSGFVGVEDLLVLLSNWG